MNTRDVIRWLNPWPIDLTRKSRVSKQWEFRIEPLTVVGKYGVLGKDKSGKHLSAMTIAHRIKRADDRNLPDPTEGRGHYIEMLARDYVPGLNSLTIIVDKKDGEWRIIDGNHRLIAALLRRLQKKPLKLKYVGVIREIVNHG